MDRGSAHHVQGFTLLELLLAIFIFSVVLTSVYGASNATFKVFNHANFETAVHERARIAIERISEDVKTMYISGEYGLFGESQEIDSRRADEMLLLTRSHLTFDRTITEGRSGIVRYSVEADGESEGFLLHRADVLYRPKVDVDPEEIGFLLCDDLWEVRFTYINEDGEEYDEWGNAPGSNSGTSATKPAMMQISLVFTNAAGDGPGAHFTTAVALGKIGP